MPEHDFVETIDRHEQGLNCFRCGAVPDQCRCEEGFLHINDAAAEDKS
jgi:hypothetical protein